MVVVACIRTEGCCHAPNVWLPAAAITSNQQRTAEDGEGELASQGLECAHIEGAVRPRILDTDGVKSIERDAM